MLTPQPPGPADPSSRRYLTALAGAIDRVELAGVDVTTTLKAAVTQEPLPDEHATRTLHYPLGGDVLRPRWPTRAHRH